MNQFEDMNLMRILQNETPILTAQIRALYAELDKKYHLRGAKIPITFGFEKDLLGSYTQAGPNEEEHSKGIYLAGGSSWKCMEILLLFNRGGANTLL